eukprot:sb/3478637/
MIRGGLFVVLLLGVVAGERSYQPDERLRAMALDSRGHVYIGAVNAIYQLDTELRLLNKTVNGPVQDNPNCLPPQLGDEFCLIEGSKRSLYIFLSLSSSP